MKRYLNKRDFFLNMKKDNNSQSDEGKKTIYNVFKLISFGTPLREALERINQMDTGALIVIANPKTLSKVLVGGFAVNCKFTPARLSELAKMDGAIIVDEKISKILYASVLLNPNSKIQSRETGIRHQSAERTAKQTGQLVIAISKRLKAISLYYGDEKYVLKSRPDLLSRLEYSYNTLRRQKEVYAKLINNLNVLEFTNLISLEDVIFVIQRAEMILRTEKTVKRILSELGDEEQILSLRLKELTFGIEEELDLILQDYKKGITLSKLKKGLSKLSYDDLISKELIMNHLGYEKGDERLIPKGNRILKKIKVLSDFDIKAILKTLQNLKNILEAEQINLVKIKGIGEKKAKFIKQELSKMKEEAMLSSNI